MKLVVNGSSITQVNLCYQFTLLILSNFDEMQIVLFWSFGFVFVLNLSYFFVWINKIVCISFDFFLFDLIFIIVKLRTHNKKTNDIKSEYLVFEEMSQIRKPIISLVIF
jgi:hypothetical protein